MVPSGFLETRKLGWVHWNSRSHGMALDVSPMVSPGKILLKLWFLGQASSGVIEGDLGWLKVIGVIEGDVHLLTS